MTNPKIQWDKQIFISNQLEPYENIQHIRVPVSEDLTIKEIEDFCRGNSWNWRTIKFEGFSRYGGAEMSLYAYFSVGIGIGD
jgi:hypothetical protein